MTISKYIEIFLLIEIYVGLSKVDCMGPGNELLDNGGAVEEVYIMLSCDVFSAEPRNVEILRYLNE